jgi:hypothetical protein
MKLLLLQVLCGLCCSAHRLCHLWAHVSTGSSKERQQQQQQQQQQ